MVVHTITAYCIYVYIPYYIFTVLLMQDSCPLHLCIPHYAEFEKERLGKIKSLDECVTGDKLLHDDESQWKEMCETRFGLSVSSTFQIYNINLKH